MSMKLCYCDGPWAYFTNQPLDKQWGDDWNDAPYEHNAGRPYNSGGEIITKVAWDGPFELPGGGMCNSPYSVERINAGAVPWLVTSQWEDGPVVVIPAGVDLVEFCDLIKQGGGSVYSPIT
jgi:hypothetical protein